MSSHARARLSRSIAMALVVVAASIGCEQADNRPRNVVVICMDTVRFDVFHGIGERVPDEFSGWSERAQRFDRVQATAPWTLPSVASALTGLYPNRHGAGALPNSTLNLDRWIPSQLRDDARTLPEILRGTGYSTTGLVAHGWFQQKFGLGRGFDRLDFLKDRDILRETSNLLRERSQQSIAPPFFLYLHLMAAHDYVRLARSEPEISSQLAVAAHALAPAKICLSPSSDICRRFTAYVLAVVGLRQKVAFVLEALEREGLLDSTVVALFSDHGEEFHDHAVEQLGREIHPRGEYGEGHGHAMYQELLHVPVLMWVPGISGGTIDSVSSLVDLTPTLLGWLGLNAAEAVEVAGTSLANGATENRKQAVFSSAIAYGPTQTVILRDGWKRVIRRRPDDRLLFDLESDPLEQRPIRNAMLESELDGLLDGYLRDEKTFLEKLSVPGLSVDEVQALHVLGYLTGLAERNTEAP